LWFILIILCVLHVSTALAEIKVFEKAVEEIVGKNQSQEQVEAFALQKAKRLAVEEAGTYISSLTVVRNYQLAKDEITALASGVVQAKIVGVPAVRLDENGIIHVRVKSRIQVDTNVLDQQIQQIMKEKGTLKKLEQERRKVKELENKLANLKSSELKRLDELNALAMAIEREREKQRLFLEEQRLRAQGELKNAEIAGLKKERQMQARINQAIAEQERARKKEAEALAKEQDRLRRAHLENEQRWNELIRKSQLTQIQWISVDDSLPLKQAMEEVKHLKDEIANLNQRMDFQFQENKKNLEETFERQIALTKPQLPTDPAEKDPFESTAEYKRRLADHEAKVHSAKATCRQKIEWLEAVRKFQLAQAKVDYLEQKVKVLEPFVNRLQSLQERKFTIPDGDITVTVRSPDADRSHFPMLLAYRNQTTWNVYWSYTDRNKARDFWKTRSYLKAEGLFQLEEKNGIASKLTSARGYHLGIGDQREFRLAEPHIFSEIEKLRQIKKQSLPEAKKIANRIAWLYHLES